MENGNAERANPWYPVVIVGWMCWRFRAGNGNEISNA
jgi:hypothetical protein